MSYQTRAIQISIIIHAAVFGLIIVGSVIFPTRSRIVTIDFSLDNQYVTQDASQKPSPSAQQERQEKIYPKKVANRIVADSPQQVVRERETETESESVLSKAISDNQAPVAAQKQKETEVSNPSKDVREQGYSSLSAQTLTVPPAGGPEKTDKMREAAYIKESFYYIRNTVLAKTTYPAIARRMGWQGKVVIAFTILSDGNIKDIKIKESCGVEMLNENAIEAVKKASPFPKPPVEAQIVLPIVYKLN